MKRIYDRCCCYAREALLRRDGVLFLVLAVVLTLCRAPKLHAQDMSVPVSVQMPLFIKVLTFDKNLSALTEGKLVIGIVFQSGHRASVAAKDEALKSIASFGERAVEGMTIVGVAIDLDDDTLERANSRQHIDALYFVQLRAVDVRSLTKWSEDHQLRTLSGIPEYVDQGVAVSVRLKNERPQIVINLPAARREGANYGAQLLRLAQVVR